MQPHRPTCDADLLGLGPNDVPTQVGVFRSICNNEVDDGIVFDPESAAGTPIRKSADPKATVVAEKLPAVTVLGMTKPA